MKFNKSPLCLNGGSRFHRLDIVRRGLHIMERSQESARYSKRKDYAGPKNSWARACFVSAVETKGERSFPNTSAV